MLEVTATSSSAASRGTTSLPITFHRPLGPTPYGQGGSIALPTSVHQLTRTYGLRGAQIAAEDAGLPLQDVLNKDFADLRGIGQQVDLGFDVEAMIGEVQQCYQTNFPGLLGDGC